MSSTSATDHMAHAERWLIITLLLAVFWSLNDAPTAAILAALAAFVGIGLVIRSWWVMSR